MADTHCKICGEPWDIYGLSHGDVAAWEANMIKLGHGCPCCIQNGKTPSEHYVKPEPLVHFTCSHCKNIITVDQEYITYDGDELVYEKPESFKTEDGVVCEHCHHTHYDTCGKCGKVTIADDMYFIQDLENGISLCQDCMDETEVCQKCQYTVWSENTENGICNDCMRNQMKIETFDTVKLEDLCAEVAKSTGLENEDVKIVILRIYNDYLGADANGWDTCLIGISQLIEQLETMINDYKTNNTDSTEEQMVLGDLKRIMEDEEDYYVAVEGY